MTLPEDTECPIGSLIQLPEIVRFGDTTWAFSEAPVLPKPKQGPVPVIDADVRQMPTDLDDGVLYYPQRVEKNNVKLHTEDAVDSQHVCPDVVVDVDPMPQDCGDHKPDASLQDFKPFTGNYKNQVDFEEELLQLGDHEHLAEQFATDGASRKSDEERFQDNIKSAIQSGVGETFNSIMCRQPVKGAADYQHRELYRQWLLEMFSDLDDKRVPKKGKLSPGVRFPVPCGGRWRQILAESKSQNEVNKEDRLQECICEELYSAAFMEQGVLLQALHGSLEVPQRKVTKTSGHVNKKRRKVDKAIAENKLPPPTNFSEAFYGLHGHEWVEAAC